MATNLDDVRWMYPDNPEHDPDEVDFALDWAERNHVPKATRLTFVETETAPLAAVEAAFALLPPQRFTRTLSRECWLTVRYATVPAGNFTKRIAVSLAIPPSASPRRIRFASFAVRRALWFLNFTIRFLAKEPT